MHHKGTIVLETERLILRRFTLADAAEMYRNRACSEEVARYLTWEPHADVGVTEDVLRDIDNPKSGRVMQKIGMTKEGVLRQNGFARGRILDEVVYAILAAEYRQQNSR